MSSSGPVLPPLVSEDHRCQSCRLSYPAIGLDDALGAIGALPQRLRQAVDDIPLEALRTRPEQGTWSALEYLCHIRDVLSSSTIRLYRTRTEEDPAIEPMYNDLRAARFRYHGRATGAVLDEIGDYTEGFGEEVSRMRPDQWHRPLHRLPGESRSALWLVRQAMHEGEHHLRDVVRVAGVTSKS